MEIEKKIQKHMGFHVESSKLDSDSDQYVWQSLSGSCSAVENINANYHNHIRHEIIDIILHEPRIVLDIGCAAGVTGAEIKRRYPGAFVIGVELNNNSAALANKRIDKVIEGSIEDIELIGYGIEYNSIDTVILADVLEHIVNPWDVMLKIKKYLTRDAQILASIPNIRNFWLLNHLARGFWSYETEGLLDVTHVRFFTLREVKRFFKETGYEVIKEGRTWDGRLMNIKIDNEGNLESEKLIIKNVEVSELTELRTLQFLVAAQLLNRSSSQINRSVNDISINQQFPNNYKAWLKKRTDYLSIHRKINTSYSQVMFYIVIEFSAGCDLLLADTIDSLSKQLYLKWNLIILAPFPAPDAYFDEIDVVSWHETINYEIPSSVLESCTKDGCSTWIVSLPQGAQLEPHALDILCDYIGTNPHANVFYTDDDVVDSSGRLKNPRFKPDFNADLFYSYDYIGVYAVSVDTVNKLGGWCDDKFAKLYDFILRVFECYGEKSIAHIPDIIMHLPDVVQSQEVFIAKKEILKRFFLRNKIDAEVHDGYRAQTFNISYRWPTNPFVSIIIPTRDRLDLLKPCLESLLAKTKYRNYEVIIVDNLSEHQETLDYFYKLECENNNIRVIKFAQNYNYSAINNFAAQYANGEYMILLNNDTVIVQENWLERMLSHGQREEVGIVGARLVFPNQTIQHAGVILGMGAFGVADHPHIGLSLTEPGYMNRAQVVQNFSAVTAACMLIRKSIYFEVGGLDEENFKVLFNDVDLCLKVRALGYKVVWTPYATVIHHGSSSIKADKNPDKAKRARQEADKMLEKWLPQLANDPAYNRNLSLKHRHFQIETETDVTWNVDFHDRPRVYAFPANESGIGEYRVRAPLRALTHAAMIESSLLPNHSATLIPDIVEIERVKPDTLLLQNGTADYLIHAWQQYRKFNDVFMIYSQDDLVHMLPGKHPLQAKWPKDVRRRLSKLMEHSDRLIVATEPLREAYSKYITDIKLVPNYLEKARWLDLKPSKQIRNGRKLRVGWAGGGQHHGDLEFIAPVIEATKDEVDWIFMGMCLDQIRPYIKEYHAGVAFDLYPQKLADLDLDLAIAPLEYNNFNMAKTNLRLLEYGILGWPVLCSDITPYQGAPVTLVGNNVNHWVKAIREKIHEPDALVKEGQALQQWVLDNYLLEDHLDEWLAALTP